MEKILEIKELYDYKKDGDEWGGTYTGFEVTTNKQSVKLLIYNEQCSCENWGYFWCNDKPADFVGAKLLDIKITDTALKQAIMKTNDLEDGITGECEGDIMFVDLVTNKGVLQFVAYNEHNGYYGHDAWVISTQLNYEVSL